jgi:ribosomal subunit interface protein
MNLKTTNLKLDTQTREYLNKKIDGLSKFFDPNDSSLKLDVEIGRISEHHQKGDVFRAEFNLSIGGKYYRAEETNESIMSAIDSATDELSKQLRRGKNKKETLFKRGGRKLKETFRNLF